MTDETAIVLEELQAEIQRSKSPWAGRKQAANYCDCSTMTIDRAANRGEIKRYWRGSDPIFKKKELDTWIEEGKK